MIFVLAGTLLSCEFLEKKEEKVAFEPVVQEDPQKADTLVVIEPESEPIALDQLADTTFVRLADYSDDFLYDMRYATTNNFL